MTDTETEVVRVFLMPASGQAERRLVVQRFDDKWFVELHFETDETYIRVGGTNPDRHAAFQHLRRRLRLIHTFPLRTS